MIIIEKSKCNGCSACANICPKNCIRMVADEEGFLYPQVDTNTCVHCGRCENICPVINPKTLQETATKAYAVINKDEEIRLNSSSGGVFSLLADYVLERGGVVFGAVFDDEFTVNHIAVENKDDLKEMRGSKYTQSRIGECYRQAKTFLESGRQVLFTGTPCQIGGLFAFLGKAYDNLLTQDLICHGVPSPLVWKKYLSYRKKQAGARIRNISFRSKVSGWKNFSMSALFDDGKSYAQTLSKDAMMQVFLKDLCLRPSCYTCAFKGINRQADITLADFWGIDRILPNMDDDKGTSLVIIHTEKGAEVYEFIRHQTISKEVEIDRAVEGNPAMVRSAVKPKRRKKCMQALTEDDFERIANKYCKISLLQRIKNKIKGILSRIKKLCKRSKK